MVLLLDIVNDELTWKDYMVVVVARQLRVAIAHLCDGIGSVVRMSDGRVGHVGGSAEVGEPERLVKLELFGRFRLGLRYVD